MKNSFQENGFEIISATSSPFCPGFDIPDSKVHGANMGPIWGRQDPGGPHGGLMNFVIWDVIWMAWAENLSSLLELKRWL